MISVRVALTHYSSPFFPPEREREPRVSRDKRRTYEDIRHKRSSDQRRALSLAHTGLRCFAENRISMPREIERYRHSELACPWSTRARISIHTYTYARDSCSSLFSRLAEPIDSWRASYSFPSLLSRSRARARQGNRRGEKTFPFVNQPSSRAAQQPSTGQKETKGKKHRAAAAADAGVELLKRKHTQGESASPARYRKKEGNVW